MNIRAHHLVCIKYFRGKGYSEGFVSNFYEVIKKLENNPIIKLVNYPDVICDACPNNANGKCIKKGQHFEDKVRKKDDEVIRLMGAVRGQELKFEEVKNIINLRLNELRKTCEGCEWREYCSYSKSL